MVAQGALKQDSHKLVATISNKGTPATTVQIVVPPDATHKSIALQKANSIERPKQITIPNPILISPVGPTREAMIAFNNACYSFTNNAIPRYQQSLEIALKNIASAATLPLRIYNEGTVRASDVICVLELPHNTKWLAEPPEEPEPPIPPKEPRLRYELANSAIPSGLMRALRDFDKKDRPRIKSLSDRGKTLIQVNVGSIHSSSFADAKIEWLIFPVGTTTLRFKIYSAEARQHSTGTFTVHVTESPVSADEP